MTIELELIGIGITIMTPVYGALWYLIILGTNNKIAIKTLQDEIRTIKKQFEQCRYCVKSKQESN